MANELTVSGRIVENAWEDSTPSVESLDVDMTGDNVAKGRMATTTGDVAVPLGALATLGWFFFKNTSATTTITIKTASSGTAVLSLLPGEFAMGRLGSGMTTPYVTGSAAENGIFEYKIFAV